MLTLRHRSAVALLLLTLVVAVGAVLAVTQRGDLAQYLAPSLASIGVLVGFSLLLWRQVGSDIFGELGSLYVGFIVAYTVVPAFAFVVTGLDEGGPLAQLLPEASELGKHLWRHVLFETGVAGGGGRDRGEPGEHDPSLRARFELLRTLRAVRPPPVAAA